MAGRVWGKEIVGGKMKFTADGGLAYLMTNKSGAASIKGYVVAASTATTNSVMLNPVDGYNPIGIFLDDGVPDGQLAWVVVSGLAQVFYFTTTTFGYFARIGIAADTGEAAGKARGDLATPADATTHFGEIGHILETRGTAGLALTNLHFN
jgi:hypothetical protein